MISDKYAKATTYLYRQTNLGIYTKQVKLVMTKSWTKMLQKHTKNVIPINLTL